MVQVPVATSVTVLPETVQVVAVVDAKLTGKPDDDVAETVNGGLPSTWLGNGANVMVCASFVIWNACVTGVGAV